MTEELAFDEDFSNTQLVPSTLPTSSFSYGCPAPLSAPLFLITLNALLSCCMVPSRVKRPLDIGN